MAETLQNQRKSWGRPTLYDAMKKHGLYNGTLPQEGVDLKELIEGSDGILDKEEQGKGV